MSRSSNSNDDAGLRNTQTEIKVPKNIESSFSNDDVGKDTELPDEIVEISSKLIDGASQKDVANDFSVHRNTVRKVVESMKEAGLLRVSGRGRGAEYHAKGILEDDLKNDPLTEDSSHENNELDSDHLPRDYPNGLGGEVLRSLDRSGKVKRSLERLGKNLNAEREEIESAMYALDEVDLLRVWGSEGHIFGELDEDFKEEYHFEPSELTENHLGVFLDTVEGYSLSEIEERRDIDRALEFRRELSYLLEERDTGSPSVEYQLTPEGGGVIGLIYAHLDAGSSYSDLFESEKDDPESMYSEEDKSDLKWTDFPG